jgi:hypothetical protein
MVRAGMMPPATWIGGGMEPLYRAGVLNIYIFSDDWNESSCAFIV